MSAEEDFNDRGDRVTPSTIPVSLSPRPALPLPGGPTNQTAMDAGMKDVHGLSHVTSTCQGQRGSGHGRVPRLPAAEANTEPPGEHHSPRGQPATGSRLVTPDLFHHGRRSFLSLAEQTLLLDLDFPLLRVILRPKLPPVDLENASFAVAGFLATLHLSKEPAYGEGGVATSPR